jgi:hypothetical protein
MKKESKKLRLDRAVVQTLTQNLNQEQLKVVAGGMAPDSDGVRTGTCQGTC